VIILCAIGLEIQNESCVGCK